MKVNVLADDKFRIVAVVDGKNCPVLDFLTVSEASTSSVRTGLIEMLTHVAEHGLQGAPSKWFHEADKASGIFEFIKGPLRLFFFKGIGRDIAICTIGVRKSGQKADSSAVKTSVRWKKEYILAVANRTYEVINDEDQQGI